MQRIDQNRDLGTERVTEDEKELARVAADCALRLQLREPGFSVREIIPPATSLYDPMLGWIDDDGSLVFCDIGGQRQPGWNPREGHGSVWRLHPDDRLEAIVPPGAIGLGMVMFPMKSSPEFGDYANQVFFLGQLKPGRKGAHNTHAVYWVPPGWDIPEVFCTVPHSTSTLGGGVSGALCPAGWGEAGTPEEGQLFLVSLMNCTLYRVASNRQIEPWLICDEKHLGVQFMPSQVFRAPEEWGELAGELIVSGRPNTSFEKPAELSGKLTVGYWKVAETGQGRRVTEVEPPPDFTLGDIAGVRNNVDAPDGFGPFGGQRFRCRPGSANLAHATKMNDGPLPYDADVVRLDESGEMQVFADQLQSGAPALIFQGDRMIVSVVRKSYSTGEYHLPDGSLYEIKYTG